LTECPEISVKKISQKESAVFVLRNIFEDLLSDIYAYRERVLKEDDNEVLHQLRISVRRSVVLMGEFSFIDRNGKLLEHRKALKTLISISNTKRDLDVLYGWVSNPNTEASYYNEALILLKKRLEEMLQKEHTAIINCLQSQTSTDILKSWKVYLSHNYQTNIANDGYDGMEKLANKVIFRRFVKIKKKINILDRKSKGMEEILHALRISFKKLRYLLETFGYLYRKKKIHKLLKEMKEFQNILGAFHDSYQQQMILEALIQNEKDGRLRVFITTTFLSDLKKYQKKEIMKIQKQLKKFLKKEKIYKKLFVY